MEWKRKEIRYRDILDMLSQDPRMRGGVSISTTK